MGVLFMHVQEEVIVDGSVVRSGRNLSVVAVEFKLEKTGQLIYTARATFYHMPVAKL
jgi:acyl-coenzyme A thioesterase 13